MKKRLLALSLCAAMLFTGCGVSKEDVEKAANTIKDAAQEAAQSELATPTPEPTATPGPTEEAVKLGKKAKAAGWKFTVSKVQTKKKMINGMYEFKPSKGNTFVVVNMKVENLGKEKETFLPRIGTADTLCAKILYEEDYEYQPTELLSHKQDLVGDSVSPLESKKGIVVFEVPNKVAKKVKKLRLRLGNETEAAVYELKK